jgi:hypothetical protein
VLHYIVAGGKALGWHSFSHLYSGDTRWFRRAPPVAPRISEVKVFPWATHVAFDPIAPFELEKACRIPLFEGEAADEINDFGGLLPLAPEPAAAANQ